MKRDLEKIYLKYNRREFVHPDPLEFLYNYKNAGDREIVGLVASSLAYGRVARILSSVSVVLGLMSPSPREFLLGAREKTIKNTFAGFKHRFTTGDDLSVLLIGAKKLIKDYGTLGACFADCHNSADETILPALSKFSAKILGKGRTSSLFPSPEMGSACKRPNLFLRWMVRKDGVDPGGWRDVPASKLIIPLDTHMHKIALSFGFTKRKSADLRTAIETTTAFSKISPDDPVRYDFSLTRFGIRGDMDIGSLMASMVGHAGFGPATR